MSEAETEAVAQRIYVAWRNALPEPTYAPDWPIADRCERAAWMAAATAARDATRAAVGHDYEYDLLGACAALHGDACGSGETLSPADRDAIRKHLRYRLDHWNRARRHGYDAAVRSLIEAALAE